MMTKPTVLALPIALLALDVWPLERWTSGWREKRWRGVAMLALEKTPLVVIALVFAVATARMVGGATPEERAASVAATWADAAYAVPAGVAWTLIKTVIPTDLAVNYPWATAWSHGQSIGGALALIVLTALIVRSRSAALIAGWAWFLVLLLPMLAASRYRSTWVADRYTIVPHLLLLAGLASAFFDATAIVKEPTPKPGELRERPRTSRSTFLRRWGAIMMALAAFVVLSARQVAYWQNSETLFRHALAVAPDSAVSHHSLGIALAEQGRLVEAADHYAHAAAVERRYADPRVNLGIVAEQLGNFALSEKSLREALELQPKNRLARFAMARLRARQGRNRQAVELYELLAREEPGAVDVRVNYGAALEMMGDRAGAEAQYRAALHLDPDDPDARANLDDLLAGRSRTSAGATRPAVP
jgi:Flp pilus assembly protein TadD